MCIRDSGTFAVVLGGTADVASCRRLVEDASQLEHTRRFLETFAVRSARLGHQDRRRLLKRGRARAGHGRGRTRRIVRSGLGTRHSGPDQKTQCEKVEPRRSPRHPKSLSGLRMARDRHPSRITIPTVQCRDQRCGATCLRSPNRKASASRRATLARNAANAANEPRPTSAPSRGSVARSGSCSEVSFP